MTAPQPISRKDEARSGLGARGERRQGPDPAVARELPDSESGGKLKEFSNTLTLSGLGETVPAFAIANYQSLDRPTISFLHLPEDTSLARDYALAAWPGLPRDLPPERIKFWMGHRPSTPDGLPCIGTASATPDVIHAYGHGHIGLASGAITGRLAADLVSSKEPAIDLAAYAPQRFRRR